MASTPCLSGKPLLVCGILCLLAAGAVGDTFLLVGGGRIHGRAGETLRGPDETPWIAVETPFGTVRFAQSLLQRRIRSATGSGGTVLVEEILVTRLIGSVDKSSDGGKSWSPISFEPAATAANEPAVFGPNDLVAPGDRLRTGDDGECDLSFGLGEMHVAPRSEVEFATRGSATMRVFRGETSSRVRDVSKGSAFRIETPEGLLAVKGTTFRVVVSADVRLAVGDGKVEFARVSVGAGQAVRVAGGRVEGPAPMSDEDRAGITRVETCLVVPAIETVVVPGAEIVLGPSDALKALWPTSSFPSVPRHRVRVPPTRIARTKVTNAQYRHFLEWIRATEDHSRCHRSEPPGHEHTPTYWGRAGFDAPDQPVVGLDWWDAYAFSTAVGGCLPSEAVWEYAVRAGTETALFWGNDVSPDRMSKGRATADGTVAPASVGGAPANAFGLHDPYGSYDASISEREWCLDTWRESYERTPSDGRAWTGDGPERVLRGEGSVGRQHAAPGTKSGWFSEVRPAWPIRP
ncbi:MAG: SUMF1/EgtB/PvdO family nonheme iron enzyme [Planctomycetes bacterium]|nr:SUMF1/EgtB/PvdO family nonheme iron enzyme [Planctomycetota bacterium]